MKCKKNYFRRVRITWGRRRRRKKGRGREEKEGDEENIKVFMYNIST